MNDFYDPTKKIKGLLSETTTKLSNIMLESIQPINGLSAQIKDLYKPLLDESIFPICKVGIDNLIITPQMESSISSTVKSATSIIKGIANVKLGWDSITPCLKAIDTLQSKYSDLSIISDWDAEEDAELMSECQVELEDISIQQMMDVLTGEYDEQKLYEEPDFDTFKQKASEIDFISKPNEAGAKLTEVITESRQFKDNRKSKEIVRNTFLNGIIEACGESLYFIAFGLLLLFLQYAFEDVEIVQEFISILKDIL